MVINHFSWMLPSACEVSTLYVCIDELVSFLYYNIFLQVQHTFGKSEENMFGCVEMSLNENTQEIKEIRISLDDDCEKTELQSLM